MIDSALRIKLLGSMELISLDLHLEQSQTVVQRQRKFREAGAFAAVLLVAFILRGWLYATGRAVLDGDECYLAIQGLDILHGSPQIFYYGQNYMGCFEAYGFALFRLFIPFSTPLTVQIMAVAQALLFLATAYLFVRRFFGRPVAWVTLLLLALPPPMLAIWLGKVRGYMPWLILGNGILYLLFLLNEEADSESSRWKFCLLGAALGLAWWANPLAIDYCVTAAVLALAWRGLRRGLWRGVFRSAPAILVNGLAIAALALLESRALFDSRKSALLQLLYAHRLALFATLALLGLLGAALAFSRRRNNYNLALLCLGFLAGDAPALWIYWSVASLNLKQGLDPWDNFLIKMILAPMMEFPFLAGLTTYDDTRLPLFPLAVNLFVIAVYLCALYCAVRSLRRLGPPLAGLLAFSALTLLLFWSANTIVVGQERYLLCLYLPFFVFIGLLVRELNLLARGLGWLVLGLMLLVHLAGLWQLPPDAVRLPSGISLQEQAILNYAKTHGLGEVLIDGSDGLAIRLTFFAEQKTVFFSAMGYFNRIEKHKQRFRNRSEYPLFCPAGSHPENKIGRLPDARFDGFEVYQHVPQGLIFKVYGSDFLH